MSNHHESNLIELSHQTIYELKKLSTDKKLSLNSRKFHKKKEIIVRLYLEGHIDYKNVLERFDKLAHTASRSSKAKQDYFARRPEAHRMEIVLDRLKDKLAQRQGNVIF